MEFAKKHKWALVFTIVFILAGGALFDKILSKEWSDKHSSEDISPDQQVTQLIEKLDVEGIPLEKAFTEQVDNAPYEIETMDVYMNEDTSILFVIQYNEERVTSFSVNVFSGYGDDAKQLEATEKISYTCIEETDLDDEFEEKLRKLSKVDTLVYSEDNYRIMSDGAIMYVQFTGKYGMSVHTQEYTDEQLQEEFSDATFIDYEDALVLDESYENDNQFGSDTELERGSIKEEMKTIQKQLSTMGYDDVVQLGDTEYDEASGLQISQFSGRKTDVWLGEYEGQVCQVEVGSKYSSLDSIEEAKGVFECFVVNVLLTREEFDDMMITAESGDGTTLIGKYIFVISVLEDGSVSYSISIGG